VGHFSRAPKGKTIGVDATTLEANAAMRSIVRRDTGDNYQEFLTELAKESGIETPTREQLSLLDRKRKKRLTLACGSYLVRTSTLQSIGRCCWQLEAGFRKMGTFATGC
jgi:hypothetical protein